MIQACWVSSVLLPLRKLPSLLVLQSAIHSIPYDVASRCRPRSLSRSTSTRAPSIASRKLLPRRVLQQVCTRALLQMLSEVLVQHLFSCSTSVERNTLDSKRSCDQSLHYLVASDSIHLGLSLPSS